MKMKMKNNNNNNNNNNNKINNKWMIYRWNNSRHKY